MAATNTPEASLWAKWLAQQLEQHGWSARELSRRSGVSQSQFTRWSRGVVPDLNSIRQICDALEVPPVEGMIAAGHLSADDVGATVIQRPDVKLLSNAELLAEIGRRMVDPAENVHEGAFLPEPRGGSRPEDVAEMQELFARMEARQPLHGHVRATKTYVELEDDEGHSRIVRIDPRSFGQEGEAWAARRRDDQDQTAQEG